MSTQATMSSKRRIPTGALRALIVALVLFLGAAVPAAHAVLERTGPVTAATFGYPSWYQDKTGIALEFCSPLNASELAGGWCLLLPADTAAPEVFPTPFSDEHFYWAGDAIIDYTTPVAGQARLVLGLEAAFGVGPVVAGDQVVFGRVRMRVDPLPYDGTYTIYTPFGTWSFPDQVAGERLFFTEDIGFGCPPGQFDCALTGKIGPFLLPSATPGGAEMAALTAANPTPDTNPAHFGGTFAPTAYPGTGKAYIADPARIGPVTGSPVGQNYYRVEGPNGFVLHSNDFTLVGRLMTGPIAGRVTVDRAAYGLSATETKLDVFATGHPTTQGRLPAAPVPPQVIPALSFYDAPCSVNGATGALGAPVGGVATQMVSVDSIYFGQTSPPAIPTEVCVMDANSRNAQGGVVPAYFRGIVGDEILITEALFNPGNGGSLSVKAQSADVVNIPVLTLVGYGPLTNGQIIVPTPAAPAKIKILSSNQGSNESQVATVLAAGPSVVTPVAVNDTMTTAEDTAAIFAVLANDTLNGAAIPAGAGTVAITANPQLGTAAVNADGTITYTPNALTSGTDGLTYTVTVAGQTSNAATVAITITPVNNAPTAVDDATQAVVNSPVAINLLSNDTDPDGAADLAGVVIVTPPGAGASVVVGQGGNVTFTATAAGTYTFIYQARDAAGLLSANAATVTVTVAGAEAIQNVVATFRLAQARWIVTGTDTIPAGQTITISYANGSAAGTVIGTAVVGPTGTWLLDIRPVTGVLNPRNVGATLIRATSSLSNAATVAGITIRNN